MLDSVGIDIPLVGRLPRLSNIRTSYDPRTGLQRTSAWFRNLHVKLKEDMSAYISVSLPNFVNGQNVDTLRFDELCKGVEEIYDSFGFDPRLARIYELDVAATVKLASCPRSYFLLLGDIPGTQMWPKENGLYWILGYRTICVYDKGREAGVDGNKLRLEVRYSRAIKKQLDWPITLYDCLDPSNFARFANLWFEAYRSINKVTPQILEPTPYPSELRKQLARIGVETENGVCQLLRQINTWGYSHHQLTSLRNEIRNLAMGGNKDLALRMLAELDSSVTLEKDRALDQALRATGSYTKQVGLALG